MPDEMRRIRRKMRGPDAHEARASLQSADDAHAQNSRGFTGQVTNFFGVGRRRMDVEIQEQFSDAWFAMALVLTLIGLVTQISALFTIAALLLTIVAVSWLWNLVATFGLEYERRFSEKRAFVGETVELSLIVANRKFLPLSWLRITDTLPAELPIEGLEITRRADTNQGELNTFWSLKWYEQIHRSYKISAVERGFFHYGPAKLETGDIFGLFRSMHRKHDEQLLIVYPKVVPLTSLGLPAKEPFGDLRAPKFMFEDPIRTVGIRDYRTEDDFRRVHWKASARRQELQTRVLEPASSHNLVVCLNVATLAQHWRGVIADILEQAISVAASICYYSLEQRWPTGLIVNGALPRSDQPIKVLPGRSPGQITALLEMLAAVTPFATAPIERLIASESPRLPWGSTLVVITAIVTDQIVGTLMDLKQMGRRVVLISLDEKPLPAELQNILVYQIAPGDISLLDLGEPVSGEETMLDPAQLQHLAIRQAGAALAEPDNHATTQDLRPSP